jgi:hypothetical protein
MLVQYLRATYIEVVFLVNLEIKMVDINSINYIQLKCKLFIEKKLTNKEDI